MAGAMILVGLVMAQTPAIMVEGAVDKYEVGHRELAMNRPQAALETIAANRAIEADDPAALINKGAAHLRLGNSEAARDSYRAALVSRQRYALELADGTWMDSRAAARLAIKMAGTGQALALK